MASEKSNYKQILEKVAKILNWGPETVKKYDKEEVSERHKKIVGEHIEYVCDQAREKGINVAEIYLSALQDGKRLTQEDIRQYALRENLITVGKRYEGKKVIAVRLYVGKVETD